MTTSSNQVSSIDFKHFLDPFEFAFHTFGLGKEKTAEKMLLQELADTNIPSGQYSGVIDKIGTNLDYQVHLFSFESLEMAEFIQTSSMNLLL